MKGAAKKMTAFKEWALDSDMAKRFPRSMFSQASQRTLRHDNTAGNPTLSFLIICFLPFSQIEFAKKETRQAGAGSWTVHVLSSLRFTPSTNAYSWRD